MSDTAAFTSFAPGFEFLQGLVKNAGAALPGVGQWVAPTLNSEELDKRIQELRTVQFWLEQNAQMLGATIQALEVQKMTLTTLQTMNVQMGDLRDALTMRMPAAAAAAPVPAPAVPPSAPPAAAAPAGEAEAQPAIDPMQWWGALTQQFSELAASALKERAAEASALVASAVPGAQPAKAAPTPGSKPAQKTASRRAGAAAAPAKKRAARKAPPRAPR